MSKTAYIDIENLKAKPKVTVDDFENRDAAFEYLLVRTEKLGEDVAELMERVKK